MSAARDSVARSLTRVTDKSAATAVRLVDRTIRITRSPDHKSHKSSHDDLVERIFHDPLSAGQLEAGNEIARRLLLEDGVDRHPVRIAQRRDGWPLQSRQQR